MNGQPSELVVEDLHKSFGSQPVLIGVDLTVAEGTFAAVLGPSGSGKTTLLRVVAGFERPERGSVTIGGILVDDDHHHVPARHRRIGYVSQEGSLFPHLTVSANIGFGLPRADRRGPAVGELLDAVGLAGLGSRYPHQLSGGQQQRVALARALAVRPRLVLLDEPFASLDANLRAAVRSDVQGILRAADTTAVLVTHDQDEALSMADVVAVIRDGRIAQVAPPVDLYARPVDPALARFVGDANILPGSGSGGRVQTALGIQELVHDSSHPMTGPVTVLIRPEQIDVVSVLAVGSEDDGTASGRVLSTDFRGHDAVVRIGLTGDGDGVVVTARILGGLTAAVGSDVGLRVHGPVRAWPGEAG